MTSGTPRSVAQVTVGQATSDGAGVKLTRVIGTAALPQVDPFLLLDDFGSDDPQAYIAGFPDHPHRGFETITYMLAGRMRHRDSKGHEGLLQPGDAQWMTAGRGLIHSEMPEQEEGRLSGFQFWLNLPAAEKMRPARYQDIPATAIPRLNRDGAVLTLLAGELDGAEGPIRSPATAPLMVVVDFTATAVVELPVAADLNGFVYVQAGTVGIGDAALGRGQVALLGDGDRLALAGKAGTRAVLAAGRPLNEPVVRHGPFVMNSREQIYQAFADYQAGRFEEE